MSENIYHLVVNDLATWEPALGPDRRRALAERILHTLTGDASWAEYQPSDGGCLFWYLDPRGHELLATYPSGANRVRTV